MGAPINRIGQKYQMLTILDEKKEKNKKYYYCECECGNKKWIRSDSVISRKQKSCGCLAKETYMKPLDLKGKKIGRLLVLEATDKRTENGCVIWKCLCDCGKTAFCSAGELNLNRVNSCGCLAVELARERMKNNLKEYFQSNYVDGTSLVGIQSGKKLMKTNKSGFTGVTYDRKRSKWVAQLEFKGKHYALGRYDNKEDAIEARKEAEKHTYQEFLKRYHESKEEENKEEKKES